MRAAPATCNFIRLQLMFYHTLCNNRKETINTFLQKQRTFFSLAFTLLNLFKFEPYSAEAVA